MLGPMKLQVGSQQPYLAVIVELLYHDECEKIKQPLTMRLERHIAPLPKHVEDKKREWVDIRVMKRYLKIYSLSIIIEF